MRAKSGGVLQRAGHTEAAVDLASMAGCRPVAMICEIMNDDGTMARLPDLLTFAKKHDLRMCSIAGLIEYRRKREKLVERQEVIQMPTDFGEFELHLYQSKTDQQNHVALVKGDVSNQANVLVCVSTVSV